MNSRTINVTDSYEAEEKLQTGRIWCEAIDDITIEVFTIDYYDALDLLADEFLLQDLVDFAEQLLS